MIFPLKTYFLISMYYLCHPFKTLFWEWLLRVGTVLERMSMEGHISNDVAGGWERRGGWEPVRGWGLGAWDPPIHSTDIDHSSPSCFSAWPLLPYPEGEKGLHSFAPSQRAIKSKLI